MTSVPYHANLNSGNSIYGNYLGLPAPQKQKVRTQNLQQVKNSVDFANFVTDAQAKIHEGSMKDTRQNPALDSQLNEWNNSVIRANEDHRRTLRNLGQNLAQIVGATSLNPSLKQQIENSCQRNLSDSGFSSPVVNPQEVKSNMDQILKICEHSEPISQSSYVSPALRPSISQQMLPIHVNTSLSQLP